MYASNGLRYAPKGYAGAGVDNAWEQGKLEARKMLLNRADSHASGARFVGWLFAMRRTHLTKDQFASVLIGRNSTTPIS